MGREMGGRFKREGTYVYLWLVHVDVWQIPTKFCKAIILQLKKNNFLKYIETKIQPVSFSLPLDLQHVVCTWSLGTAHLFHWAFCTVSLPLLNPELPMQVSVPDACDSKCHLPTPSLSPGHLLEMQIVTLLQTYWVRSPSAVGVEGRPATHVLTSPLGDAESPLWALDPGYSNCGPRAQGGSRQNLKPHPRHPEWDSALTSRGHECTVDLESC